MTAAFQWFDIDHETEDARAFYEACRVGDISYESADDTIRRQTCGVRLASTLMYCTRWQGHAGTRHVAEGITVLAVSE